MIEAATRTNTKMKTRSNGRIKLLMAVLAELLPLLLRPLRNPRLHDDGDAKTATSSWTRMSLGSSIVRSATRLGGTRYVSAAWSPDEVLTKLQNDGQKLLACSSCDIWQQWVFNYPCLT